MTNNGFWVSSVCCLLIVVMSSSFLNGGPRDNSGLDDQVLGRVWVPLVPDDGFVFFKQVPIFATGNPKSLPEEKIIGMLSPVRPVMVANVQNNLNPLSDIFNIVEISDKEQEKLKVQIEVSSSFLDNNGILELQTAIELFVTCLRLEFPPGGYPKNVQVQVFEESGEKLKVHDEMLWSISKLFHRHPIELKNGQNKAVPGC